MSAKPRRKNPIESAERAYKLFHGHDAVEHFLVKEMTHWHANLAGIGKLQELVIEGSAGEVTLTGFGKDCLLAMNEKRTQLYIKGGDQSVDLRDFGIDPGEAHDFEVLGQLVFVSYHTNKTHLAEEDGGVADYEHWFGSEEDEDDELACPTIIYDTLNERLQLAGGDYTIDAEGIIH